MLLFLILASCRPTNTNSQFSTSPPSETTEDEGSQNSSPILSPNRMWEIPQSSEEWWDGPDELSSSYAGAGILIEDINLDGLLDLVLLRRNGNRLLLQSESGWDEKELPTAEGVGANGSIVDFDQDGDQDILLNMLWGEDILLIQDEGSWEYQSLPSPYFSASSSWYDFNKDGRLDLAIAGYGDDDNPDFDDAFDAGIPYSGERNRLFVQTEDGQLTEAELLPELSLDAYTFNLTWLPIDTDQDWDLFSVNDFGMLNGGHQIFWNQDAETFALSDRSLGLEAEMFGMGIAVADLNDDQRPDLSITNIGSIVSFLSDQDSWYDNTLSFGFSATEERHTSWGIDWGDVNNDGQPDLWIGYGPLPGNGDPTFYNPEGQPDALFLWTEEGYQEISTNWGIDRQTNTRAGGFADLNRDGCLDLIRASIDGPVEIFRGECSGNWLIVQLDDGNRGIGSRIDIVGSERSQADWILAGGTSFSTYLPLESHFGLGEDTVVDIRVVWPDGSEQLESTVDANQIIRIRKE